MATEKDQLNGAWQIWDRPNSWKTSGSTRRWLGKMEEISEQIGGVPAVFDIVDAGDGLGVSMGDPQNGEFLMENPMKHMNDFTAS